VLLWLIVTIDLDQTPANQGNINLHAVMLLTAGCIEVDISSKCGKQRRAVKDKADKYDLELLGSRDLGAKALYPSQIKQI
jgi:hypothetical protein